jgi:hypothetical protein
MIRASAIESDDAESIGIWLKLVFKIVAVSAILILFVDWILDNLK